MVTREAEWDDRQRALMLALSTYEAGVCDCGMHSSLTSDPANAFTFETRTCTVCKGVEQYRRVQQESDERATANLGENAPASAPRPSDGRRVYIRRMSPAEVEQRRAAHERARQRSRGSSPGARPPR